MVYYVITITNELNCIYMYYIIKYVLIFINNINMYIIILFRFRKIMNFPWLELYYII